MRGKPGAWDPSVCLSWGEQFLRFLKSIVSGCESVSGPARPSAQSTGSKSTGNEGDENGVPESATKVWRVKFDPGAGVSVALLDEEGVREVEGGDGVNLKT